LLKAGRRLATERDGPGSQPLDAIYHGPLERAAETASIIAASLPGMTASASDLVGDYIPADPDLTGLPGDFAEFVRGYDAGERAEGRKLASAAIDRLLRQKTPAPTAMS
jgi:hypothetical protein